MRSIVRVGRAVLFALLVLAFPGPSALGADAPVGRARTPLKARSRGASTSRWPRAGSTRATRRRSSRRSWCCTPIHDALVKPMPAGDNTPSLAESWTVSKDGLTYEFVLRKGVKFHNGEPVTAEDVKFSFDRYKGAAAKLLKDKVREVQIVDPGRVRFAAEGAVAGLHDVLRHVGHRRGVDRAEEIRREGGRRRLQEGADRRRAVPRRELQSRRRARDGSVRGLLAQGAAREAAGVQEHARRDDAGGRAQGGRRGHRLFPERADRRRRSGGRPGSGSPPPCRPACRTSTCRISGIRSRRGGSPRAAGGEPRARSQRAEPGRDPRALAADRRHHPALPGVREVVRAAGLRSSASQEAPGGGGLFRTASMPAISRRSRRTSRSREALANYLQAVGIRTRVRTMERAAFLTAWREKKLKGVIMGLGAPAGNAATRIEAYVTQGRHLHVRRRAGDRGSLPAAGPGAGPEEA